jgi:hypothetical protein
MVVSSDTDAPAAENIDLDEEAVTFIFEVNNDIRVVGVVGVEV